MAPITSDKTVEFSERPLADYFWIAGLDAQDLLEAYRSHNEERETSTLGDSQSSRAVEETIQEDAVAEEQAEEHAESCPEAAAFSTSHSRQSSYQRLTWLSSDRCVSMQSSDKFRPLPSARSSATIRRVVSPSHQSSLPPSPGHSQFDISARDSHLLSDVDFENVLSRFTHDRDAFYLDLNFKSSAVTPRQSDLGVKSKSRTQRIVAEELEICPVPNRTLGSVRRHMSFKDMNSVKRQTSIVRKVSTRSARRMTSYNSVMPMPQPLHASTDEHPLKRSFEPVLLDRYPRPSMTEELKRRDAFPDFVPMFAFPNDIHIVSSDTRPAAKWHEFFLTASDNTKTPAVCVIIWIPLDRKTADDLEKRCEEWRKAHMTETERELAASLGERLAAERAKLSRLLASLPLVESGTAIREDLEDEISTVEEKISLMSDMLRPLRHGASNRIEGLTDGDTGLWIPRAYGIIGKDQSMSPFWKEWLKAVVVPMLDGAVLGVPPSSPRIGMWQPLERYVHTICTQALLPMSSKVQVEVQVRELRLYAKKEARNELPGSRSVDLYPLFRCLTIPNILVLFEYLLAESRIILVSASASLLKLADAALMSLMWPLEWSGVNIPVVPTRLIEVLEAPIPYICGVVRKSDKIPLPQDEDFIMVDLDKNELHATAHPPSLPKQHRRKLMSLLYHAAPHHQTRGVPIGPPPYTLAAFPNDNFVSEHPTVFAPISLSSELGKLANLSSTQFGAYAMSSSDHRTPILNAFAQAKPASAGSIERSLLGSNIRRPSCTAGSDQTSPIAANFPALPTTPQSRNDSGFALQTSLKEMRSGNLDTKSKYTPSISNIKRKASLPFVRHAASQSQASDLSSFTGTSNYAHSMYAQSTLAASTVMPGVPYQAVRNTENVQWVEGHCLQWRAALTGSACSVCDEKSDEGLYRCSDCPVQAHSRCVINTCIPCRASFYPEQVRVAFARFFTSLFQNYRRFMVPADPGQRKVGLRERLNVDAWLRSLPPEHAEYLNLMKQTQSFDTFVHERESKTSSTSDSVALFDALMASKKGRSRGVRSSIALSLSGRNPFAGRSHSGGVPAEYLFDTSDHIWRVVKTSPSSERVDLGAAAKGRNYRDIVTRAPAKLEDDLFPTATPPPSNKNRSLRYRMNGLSMHAP